jgi:hypothetical protein
LVSQSQEHFSEKAIHRENSIKLMEKLRVFSSSFWFILWLNYLAPSSGLRVCRHCLNPNEEFI